MVGGHKMVEGLYEVKEILISFRQFHIALSAAVFLE